MGIGVFLIILIVLIVFVLAMLMIVHGVKGIYSHYQDTIGLKQMALKKEIELLKNRLDEVEKKINI